MVGEHDERPRGVRVTCLRDDVPRRVQRSRGAAEDARAVGYVVGDRGGDEGGGSGTELARAPAQRGDPGHGGRRRQRADDPGVAVVEALLVHDHGTADVRQATGEPARGLLLTRRAGSPLDRGERLDHFAQRPETWRGSGGGRRVGRQAGHGSRRTTVHDQTTTRLHARNLATADRGKSTTRSVGRRAPSSSLPAN